VTYRGRPIVCGSVLLVGDGCPARSGLIDSAGQYTVKGVPVGQVRAAVISLDPARPSGKVLPNNLDRGKSKPAPKYDPKDRGNWAEPDVDRSKWFPLPARYGDHDQSGVTTTLRRGDNTFDIELK
jgi:hypothetical protein